MGELNARIEDSLLGNRVVRAFGNEKLEIEKFQQDNLKFLDIKNTRIFIWRHSRIR